jgi:drug/metabolite transporter (DMT)-like permease
MSRERTLAYVAFATVCLVWGTTYLAIRIAIETIPPFLMIAMRFLVAGGILLAIARWRGEAIPRDRSTLVNLFLAGFLMIAVGNLAVVWAEQWVPSGMAALLVATAPFWMAIIEGFRTHGERTNLRAAMGMLIGFIGVAMLVTPGGTGGTTWDFNVILGALAIQIGSICWQLGTIRGKYHLGPVPLVMSAALQMLAGGIVSLFVGLALGEPARLSFNPRTFAALVYLTLFGSIVAYSAYIYAMTKIRTTTLSLYAYINPVVAVILGWLILDERMTWVSITASVVILGGVALVQTSRGSGPKAPVIEAVPAEYTAA